MKYTMTSILVDKNQWINYQNEALNYLNTTKKGKVSQQDILSYASRGVILLEKQKIFTDVLKDRESNKVAFMPIAENIHMNVDSISFDLKTYYLENYLDDLTLDFKPTNDFVLSDTDEKINNFVDDYVKNQSPRKFRTTDDIEPNDHVILDAFDPISKRRQRFELLAKAEKDNTLESKLVGMKPKSTFDFDLETTKLQITIIDVFYYLDEKLNDDNVKEMQIPGVFDLKSLKDFIFYTTKEEVVTNSLFTYGMNIYKEIKKFNKPIDFPQDLIQSDIDGFNFDEKFEGDKVAIVKETLTDFFWLNVISKKYDIFISNEEIKEEIAKVKASLNPVMDEQIDPRRISDAILMQKLGTIFLKKYHSDTYIEIEKYLRFK
ncbi:trigger factor-related chaperone [Mycoplasma sp. 4423]